MNTSTLSVSSALLSFLFLAACGGGTYDLNDDVFRVDGGGNSLTDSLERADFRCDTANCPKNIGLLATTDYGYGAAKGQCTAFLVADDIVATNSHCIPDALKSSYYSRDCSGYLAIRFQADNGKKETFKCRTMLNFSNYETNSGGQDFAFFKIPSTGRKPFTIHKTGIKDNQRLTIQKITPLKHSFGGRLAVQKCRNVQNSLVNMDATNPWSTSGAVVDCDVTNGNSGSPIVNTSGQVVGIAQAFWKDSYVDSIRNYMKDLDIFFDKFPKHSLFTNLSCVKDPITNMIDQNLCSKAEKVDFGQCILPTSNKVLNNMQEKVFTWSADLNPSFVYKINNINKEFLGIKDSEEDDGKLIEFTATPICAKSSASRKSFLSNELKIVQTYQGSMFLEPKMSIDEDLRLDFNASDFKTNKGLDKVTSFTLNPETKGWKGRMGGFDESDKVIIDDEATEIPECSDEVIAEGNLVMYTMDNGTVVALKDYRYEDDYDEEDLADHKTCKELGAM